VPIADTKVVFASSVSVTVIPAAVVPVVDKLALLTLIEYVRLFPTVTGSGLSLFVMLRSARPMTVVDEEAVLFPGTGSPGAVSVTLVVLLMTAPLAVLALTVPVTVIVALEPASMVRPEHVIGAVPAQFPEAAGDTTVKVPGGEP
jgi:hypothetical protein